MRQGEIILAPVPAQEKRKNLGLRGRGRNVSDTRRKELGGGADWRFGHYG